MYFFAYRQELSDFFRKLFPKKRLQARFEELNDFLEGNLMYYKHLGEAGRVRFVDRLNNFMEKVDFVGVEGMQLKTAHRVLIAASCVQLTFGIRDFVSSFTGYVTVFPAKFYSKWLNKWLYGLTIGNGNVFFAWNAFMKGNEIKDDNLNLGLHEMSHLLLLAHESGEGVSDLRFSFYFEHFELLYDYMKKEGLDYLRAYGQTNQHEFFAVAVEAFFESPDEMRQKMPITFNLLCALLNQNPLNVQGDYRLNFKVEDELKQKGIRISGVFASVSNKIYIYSALIAYVFNLIMAVIIIYKDDLFHYFINFFWASMLAAFLAFILVPLLDVYYWGAIRKMKFIAFVIVPIITFILYKSFV